MAPADAVRRDMIWRESGMGANYLTTSRQAIPLANEQLDAMLRVLAAMEVPVCTVLDIGASDGVTAAAVAERFSVERVTLVDFSTPMLDQAAKRFRGRPWVVGLMDVDLGSPAWQDALPQEVAAYDVVVSRYAIHHLPDERKQELDAEILGQAVPGGMFANIEHASSAVPAFAGIFNDLIIEGMVATSGSGQGFADAAAFHAKQDAATNILAPAEVQCG
jgi:tRNA (cmo5U34)-methyltransferase